MKLHCSLGLALGFSCATQVEGEKGLLNSWSVKPLGRYHFGRTRILTLCQNLRAKVQSQVDSFYGTQASLKVTEACRGHKFTQTLYFTLTNHGHTCPITSATRLYYLHRIRSAKYGIQSTHIGFLTMSHNISKHLR